MGTGYVLNSSGPSMINKQSIDSMVIRENNVDMDSTPFIKIDVQTRQQKKKAVLGGRQENGIGREIKEMKFNIQGGVQIIVSPDTRELIESYRQSNKSPS